MTLSDKLDQLNAEVKANRWMRYFTIFSRVALAAGFLPSGFVKVSGERFTDLSNNHPMGQYLEALFHTGYYYPFIGVVQMTAAILLLIPRTATLGVFLYFPIILNICILSHSVRFDGSLHSSPLMVLACLYLLCWDYDKIKYILPFHRPVSDAPKPQAISNKFPFKFFGGAFAAVVLLFVAISQYDMMPRNTRADCMLQCRDSKNPGACSAFCDSIHLKGRPLNKTLDQYYHALKKAGGK